jgi:hypothetical protein
MRAWRGSADCRQKVHTFVAEQGAVTRLALSFEKTVQVIRRPFEFRGDLFPNASAAFERGSPCGSLLRLRSR